MHTMNTDYFVPVRSPQDFLNSDRNMQLSNSSPKKLKLLKICRKFDQDIFWSLSFTYEECSKTNCGLTGKCLEHVVAPG